MLDKIKQALRNLKDRLTYREGDLDKSRRRAKKFSALAAEEHRAQKRLEREGKTVRAAYRRRRASARQKKAVYWKGRLKTDLAAKTDLLKRVKKREDELAEWVKAHGVQQLGENKFRGGDPHERIAAAAMKACANWRAGTQPGYYSMSGGARDYDHAINHYPAGRIWDCSTFADGVYLCCGEEAPSGPRTRELGGWTGTQFEHGHTVSRAEAKPGDLILYGSSAPGHHVEVLVDAEQGITIGHGSAPVDPGVIDLFGDGDYTIRRYV